jgi:hypothetical protein
VRYPPVRPETKENPFPNGLKMMRRPFRNRCSFINLLSCGEPPQPIRVRLRYDPLIFFRE